MSYKPLDSELPFSKKLADTIKNVFPTVVLNSTFQITIFFLVLFLSLFIATMIGVSKKETWRHTIGWLCFTSLFFLFFFYGVWYFQDSRWGKYTIHFTGLSFLILILFLIILTVILKKE